jgi:hypothetical protein
MAGHDDHDLERRLREQRPVARDEFVQGLAAETRSRSHPSARPRLTLAFALSLALLVSLVAFGGVGAAKTAFHSSTSSLSAAWGGRSHKHHGKDWGNGSPAHNQYHSKVDICYPKTKYVITWTTVTVTKTVWKWQWVSGSKWQSENKWRRSHHGHKVKVPVQITYTKHVRVKTPTTVYFDKMVSQSEVAYLVSKGAVYPVPANGCESLDTATT